MSSIDYITYEDIHEIFQDLSPKGGSRILLYVEEIDVWADISKKIINNEVVYTLILTKDEENVGEQTFYPDGSSETPKWQKEEMFDA